ncbi:CheR family methyltransferase [Chondromyces apiculatus]|uniref:protein-glutamate O-methyltransferase n=1 Tax=Chondromyces apiculatus DSM 436 TaxID=1192034 RepID=A0A017T046_9BACT|nr:protein-glutamate O-methyltransferase CheR [Chondromyces apiculatus]EYF02563.1 Chemotaxis protein methyltransferase CheR [Chondromyces apiculatus DSM 436]
MNDISDAEFALFQALIQRETGIYLSPAKKALLVARLTGRLRATQCATFGHYYGLVKEDPAERIRVVDCITTNETHFFREPKHFEFLVRHVFPEWQAMVAMGKRAPRVRAWSAACSTGKEPYSLAMTLLHHLGGDGRWSFEIVATDISTQVLDRATRAVWPIEDAAEIPTEYLKAFMLRGQDSQAGKMKAGREIRDIVHFRQLNLNDEVYEILGTFDLIFCRNVLIYFQETTKRRIVGRLVDRLAPEGYLLFGHAEGMSGADTRLRSVLPTVYRLAPKPRAPLPPARD